MLRRLLPTLGFEARCIVARPPDWRVHAVGNGETGRIALGIRTTGPIGSQFSVAPGDDEQGSHAQVLCGARPTLHSLNVTGASTQRSVPILISFVRAVLRYTDVGGLGFRELGQLGAKFRELQARHFLVQVLW